MHIKAVQAGVFEVPKELKKSAVIHEKLGAVVEISQTFVETVDNGFTKVSDVVKRIFGALSFVGAAGLIFAIPSMISNITKAIANSHPIERAKNIGRAILDATAVWMSTNAILNGLQAVRVLSSSALSWTYIVNVALFPLQLIGIGIDSYELSETKSQKTELLARLDVKDLTKSLNYVKKNHGDLAKFLGISKKCEIEKKAQALKQDKQASEAFIQMLRRRVNTIYNLKVANLVIKVSALVVTGTLLFIPNPISMGIAGVCGLAGLATFGVEKLLLPKDPFTQSDSWYGKTAEKARQLFGRVTDALDTRTAAAAA